jgi:hypothetical protein
VVNFSKKLVHFIKGKRFWTHLTLIVLTCLSIIFGTLFYLDSLTHFGEKIKVPNFIADRVNATDLPAYVSNKKISYEVLDSVYRTDLPSGTVFYQDPAPTDSTGVYVKEGRKIKLRVTTNFQLVEMPQLAGKSSRRYAEATLKNRHLVPVIEFVPSNIGKEQVMEQKYKGKSIKAGTKIPMGSKIVIVVSKGYSGNTVMVPDLTGLTISEAKARLSENNLTLYTICSDCDAATNLEAIIYNQSPSGADSSQVNVGSTITAYASLSGH